MGPLALCLLGPGGWSGRMGAHSAVCRSSSEAGGWGGCQSPGLGWALPLGHQTRFPYPPPGRPLPGPGETGHPGLLWDVTGGRGPCIPLGALVVGPQELAATPPSLADKNGHFIAPSPFRPTSHGARPNVDGGCLWGAGRYSQGGLGSGWSCHWGGGE